MTVETETVTSIPQVALTPGIGAQGSNGSLRTKPSTETIRPKKEKRKAARKQPAVNSGTGEQKILKPPCISTKATASSSSIDQISFLGN
jgi:hypothetical protein